MRKEFNVNLVEEMDLLYAKIHTLEDACAFANMLLNQRDEIEEGLNKRIAELENFISKLIDVGNDVASVANDIFDYGGNGDELGRIDIRWQELVKDWKESED